MFLKFIKTYETKNLPLWEQGVPGSNPGTPTQNLHRNVEVFLFDIRLINTVQRLCKNLLFWVLKHLQTQSIL